MTNRSYIRVCSYILFSLIILIAAVFVNTNSSKAYKAQLELEYQQSLLELGESLDSVNTDLTKQLYSNSSGEIYDVSRDLYVQCNTAKNAISRLPAKQMELNNAYKFLSQAADYAQYIGSKIGNGEEISQEEHKTLNSLLKYSQKLKNSTEDMISIVQAGGEITSGEIKNTSLSTVSAMSDSFSSSAKIFENFPTLLYDGPFSDQVLNKKSQMIQKAKVMTKDECKEIAANAIGVSVGKMSFDSDDKGRIPCYTFNCGRYTVSVTKQGGYIKSILYSGIISETNITKKNACNIAVDYLKKLGYEDMAYNYCVVTDNICTVNCAYQKDGITCYSDLIKVGISMTDGTVLTVDATTYLTNHTERKTEKTKVNLKDAESKVSKFLKIKSSKRCIIPKENGKEEQCYEFTCQSKDTGEEALVYINCKSGDEEDIMLLLKSDNGTLVK